MVHARLIDFIVEGEQRKIPETDLFSREFLFSSAYAKSRNRRSFGGLSGGQSLLSFLLRDAMDIEHRNNLFPKNFDLGNMRQIPSEQCFTDSDGRDSVTEELTSELRIIFPDDQDLVVQATDLKKIKEGIASLTRRKMVQHYAHNKSKALKVVKLLYRLNNDRLLNSLDDENNKRPQLMAMLRRPDSLTRKPSLSFRSAHPYAENEEQVFLISDLKVYLSIELDDERYLEIGGFHDFMEKQLSKVAARIDNEINVMCHTDQAQAYKRITEALASSVFEPLLADIDLDEDLYFHLNALEFAHYAVGYSELLKKAKPVSQITPIPASLDKFAKELMQYESGRFYDVIFSADDTARFVDTYEKPLIFLVGKALGKVITRRDLESLKMHVFNLLCIYAIFGKGKLPLDTKVQLFSTLELVAAICCVHDELSKTREERTQHKPYWKGQNTQGRSILTTLEKWTLSTDMSKERVPEEHYQIWTHRFEWVMAALIGCAELKTQQLIFRSALADAMNELSKTNNMAAIHKNLRLLDTKLTQILRPV